MYGTSYDNVKLKGHINTSTYRKFVEENLVDAPGERVRVDWVNKKFEDTVDLKGTFNHRRMATAVRNAGYAKRRSTYFGCRLVGEKEE